MNSKKTIDTLASDFLAYKHSIGYGYRTAEIYLKCFVKYLKQYYPDKIIPDRETVLSYLNTKTELPGSLYGTIAMLREFSRYLNNQGYKKAYVIPPKQTPKLCPEPPYFFTEEEIVLFFKACDFIESHTSFKGREVVLPALFRILYCCGLRCKEARELLCADLHLSDRYFDVLQSKGPKSRRIFISQELTDYLVKYNSQIERIFPTRTYFFPQNKTDFYKSGFIPQNFKRLWKIAFPDFQEPITRPRAYDFRHHFVWANLNRWTREGKDINAMLPYLVRYMGHQHLKCTLYYFHFVPEFFSTFTEMSRSLEDILPEVIYEEE